MSEAVEARAAVTDGALPVEQLSEAYRAMRSIRLFEERIEKLHSSGRIRGSTHLGIGQEAVAVGARAGCRDGDLVAPTYRGHGWAIAWGTTLAAAFGEMFGKETGCNRGRGGSKHFSDRDHGVLPANAIVAGALPIACGTALQAKLDGEDFVSVVPFGDGATNQAVFHEALNLAAIWKLAVVFVCENNLYSEMTPISAMAPYEDMVRRADSYLIPTITVDGMDVEAVAVATAEAAARARAGDGPTFIEAKTYRFCGHMPGDTEPYRSVEEIDEWRKRDPLPLCRNKLLKSVDTAALEGLDSEIEAAVVQAEQEAHDAAEPELSTIALGAATWMEAQR